MSSVKRLKRESYSQQMIQQMKVVYLVIQAASKKWTMPIRNWKPALNRFMIEFEERLAEYRQSLKLADTQLGLHTLKFII